MRDNGICELDLFVGRTSSQEVERRLCHRCAADHATSQPCFAEHTRGTDCEEPSSVPSRSASPARALTRSPPSYALLLRWTLAVTPDLECCLVRTGSPARRQNLVSQARLLCFRCDQRASTTWHHGVQGACMRPRLRYTRSSHRARAQADIHTARMPGKPLQEVHRFLLTDANGQPIDDPVLRDRVVKQARLLHLLHTCALFC